MSQNSTESSLVTKDEPLAADGHRVRLLRARWAIAVAQALTIVLTWPLWQVRDSPPVLPAVDVWQAPFGVALLATLAVVLVRAKLGIVLHVGVLLLAILSDQTRLQPQIVSHAILLVATLPYAAAGTAGRAHLISMWIWAGANKLLSAGFATGSAGFMAGSLGFPGLTPVFAWAVPVAEIATGLLVAWPRTRRIGIWWAVGVHGMILLVLLSAGWNSSVWPWNVALPIAAAMLFHPDVVPRRQPGRRHMAVRVLVGAAVLAYPGGFYVGVTDAYLAHNLYTDNTASAVVCDASGACTGGSFSSTWSALNVPLPPETRVFESFFQRVCRPGEVLVVYAPQWRWGPPPDSVSSTMECLQA